MRYAHSPEEVKRMDTHQLRSAFLIDDLFVEGQIQLTYTHYDRMIVGGIQPSGQQLILPTYETLKAGYFLERRELGIINLGAPGVVIVDHQTFILNHLDVLYIGMGNPLIAFENAGSSPALFYLLSCPAHQAYPIAFKPQSDATPVRMGSHETANARTVYKYIFLEGIQSCQLVMGVTILDTGNVWNTMPPHLHDRRMEAYVYFNLPESQRVSHFMGTPDETRHMWVGNFQTVLSPPWSIHSGCGTSAYGFVWGMAGENKDYTDMDFLTLDQVK